MDKDEIKKLLEEMVKASNEPLVKGIDDVFAKYFKSGEGFKKVAGEETDADKEKRFKSLGELALAVKSAYSPGGKVDERLIQKDSNATGMSEADQTSGGILVQTDMAAGMMEDVQKTGILVPRCKSFPISSNSNGMVFNGLDESSRANGSRYGGMQAYWENEADQMTKTKPKFREVRMKLRKLTGLSYITDELLTDVVALGAYLSQGFASEFGFKLDDAIVNGLGSGQPLGFLNAPCLVTITKETDQEAASIVYNNIVKMWTSMPLRSRANAVWLINPEVEDQLVQLMLEGKVSSYPAYMPPGGLSTSPYGTLMSRPVLPIEQASALGTVGDISLVDLQEYILITKGGAESATSIHLRFDYNETVFRWTLRIDGQPLRNSALAPYKGSKSLSPFVTLAARA